MSDLVFQIESRSEKHITNLIVPEILKILSWKNVGRTEKTSKFSSGGDSVGNRKYFFIMLYWLKQKLKKNYFIYFISFFLYQKIFLFFYGKLRNYISFLINYKNFSFHYIPSFFKIMNTIHIWVYYFYNYFLF